MEINEIPVNGESYKNKVKLEGTDIKPIEHSYTVKGVEESLQEKAYSIAIKTIDKDSEEQFTFLVKSTPSSKKQ